MGLVLEIEYLSGACFAAVAPHNELPDWPPQPDRVFSALVATWGARGEDAAEARALEWLEKLPAPELAATDANVRTAATVFVPPNDPRSDRAKSARGVVPALRSRQPRRFPAAWPYEPVIRYRWSDARPDDATLAALERLARDTAYVGHSSSLTRCRFVRQEGEVDERAPRTVAWASVGRWVYEGRFAELRSRFAAGRRPLPGARVAPVSVEEPVAKSVFSDRWLLLEHVGGTMPDVRASALVAKAVREALLSGYRRAGSGGEVPEEVSGHRPEGGPTQAPHLAIVPLPFAGFRHADGHVMGFALVPPRGSRLLEEAGFRQALREIVETDAAGGRRILTVRTKEGTPRDRAFSVELMLTLEPGARTLDPALYTRPATIFATATPVALDRHLKKKGAARQVEVESQIREACGNIGLPEPMSVVADKHSALEGAASAARPRGAPAWTAWRLPPMLQSRQLTHAVIRFDTPVAGPVLLGAGRYHGLGLCRPAEAR